jgi:hypothetical protein
MTEHFAKSDRERLIEAAFPVPSPPISHGIVYAAHEFRRESKSRSL